ncbi:MAG: type II toxin-antitoxin system VapC family toxin [Acidobacteria bacterium]|nr:type II toxin-antitoxin system VapC family toxin [Acidobacteriota bacterium]
MIVADANLLVYLVIEGERTLEAVQAYQRDPDWVAPFLWRSEFRSALTLYRRRGLLTAKKAFAAMAKAESLIVDEVLVNSADVLALSFGSRCSAYDCEYVALARELGVPLVTSDARILSEFPSTAVALERFIA